jgi:hypothetical protein
MDMKTKSQLSLTILALSILLPSFSSYSQNEFVKEFKKDFAAGKNTQLEISNKYGDVDIKDWNNESVAIEVKIIVRCDDKEKADRIFDYILIHFEQEGDILRATTEFKENLSDFLRDFNDDEKSLEVNYSVYMPKTMPLNVSNKYGSVFINELTSTSTIDVKYGKLTANKILHDSQQPLTKVVLGYSNATIQECKWVKLDIKYSKIQIPQSKAIIVQSKYSKIYIDNGSSLICESKYDTYELGKLNNLVASAGYTHFNIAELDNKLQIESKYSDVEINHVPADFEQIKIDNSYGSYKIGIAADASYHIDGNARYCKINFPEEVGRVSRFNENNEMKVNGLIGKNEDTKSSVVVNSSYGNIRLVK